MQIKSIHSKILILVVAVIAIGVIAMVYWGYKTDERHMLEEKLRSSQLMSEPILHSIYKDMLEERADLARHLIKGLREIEGIERVQIIRGNGVEEAFQDLKTIEAVKKEFGEVKPEWLENHPEKEVNVADGVNTEGFLKAFAAYKAEWASGPRYYTEDGDRPLLTYLLPIEKRSKCNACHEEEGARGILMISSSLEAMYDDLAYSRFQWLVVGVITIFSAAVLLSILIKKTVTGPIEKTAQVIKRIGDGGGSISERVEVSGEDEIAYLARAFNSMLDSLKKRDEANRKLFLTVMNSKEEWVSTFDSIQDFISIHDREHRVVKINRALANKSHAEPENLIGKKCFEVLSGYRSKEQETHSCPIGVVFDSGGPVVEERDDLFEDGRTYAVQAYPVIDDSGKITACVHVASDVTEQKMLKDQLLHTEKISSIGKFVAGIAHELNNPLMGIMGFSQLLMESPGDKLISDAGIQDKLGKIFNESLRSAKIVQNLLTFSRAKKITLSKHNLNNIVKETLELSEGLFFSGRIEISLDLDDSLPDTMIDYLQMQQVFINILNNAVDAMTNDGPGGKMSVSTMVSGEMLQVVFTDDGPGIDEENINKVVDPFFTTKEIGKGTGLGLSITHGIIVEHGGTLDFASPASGGTRVTVALPLVNEAEQEILVESIEVIEDYDIFQGKKVLVVDDEDSIREILIELLELKGFVVDSAGNGEEALQKIQKKEFDLIVSDIKMPKLTGMELYFIAVKDHPNLKKRFVILTGDVLSEEAKSFIKSTGCLYILKPFNPVKLQDTLHKALLA